MVRQSLLALILILVAGCSPKARVPDCDPSASRLFLYSQNLKTHKDFDKLDDALGMGEGVWKAYNLMLKLDPDNTLLKVRAAWALFYQGPPEKGASAALSLLSELEKSHPKDPDVRFLKIVFATEEYLKNREESSAGHITKLTLAFQRDFPQYRGPHGTTITRILKILQGTGH